MGALVFILSIAVLKETRTLARKIRDIPQQPTRREKHSTAFSLAVVGHHAKRGGDPDLCKRFPGVTDENDGF